MTALVVEGNYIVCRAFCSLNKLPVDEKRLGNVEQLKGKPRTLNCANFNLVTCHLYYAGYLSINVFDGPLAVVVYHNRVCVHDLSNEDTFNQPLVLTVKSDIGYVHCVAFQHNIAEHSSTQLKSYIFMRFRGSVSSSREWIVLDCTNIYSMREQSDSIIEGELMYDSGDNSSLLSQRHRSVCLPNDRPVSSIVVQEGFPGLEVSGTEVVNIAYATIIGGSRYSSNIRHTAVAGAQRRRSKSLLAVTLCTSGLLSCSENGQFTFKRALPLAGVTGHDYLYEIELRTTDSATSPLLLLQYRHTLLVLDLMNEGTVLKEFSNIGAYACAPLFHPLECHLLIVPASEQATRKLTFLSHGKTYNGSTDGLLDSAVVEPAAAAPSNGGEASLQNYFVYELPTSPSNTTLRVNRNGIGVRAGAGAGAPSVCRSMDPHGLWREGAHFLISHKFLKMDAKFVLFSQNDIHFPWQIQSYP